MQNKMDKVIGDIRRIDAMIDDHRQSVEWLITSRNRIIRENNLKVDDDGNLYHTAPINPHAHLDA